MPHPSQPRKWWKEGVCYQVWPLSFQDSNGDGQGDIQGLLGRLDHLQRLGVDYVWLSPMYASPRDDYGYDISDYEAVDPVFGTLDDMDELIRGLHDRGMRLILDLVINHTSDQHQWFVESRKSKDGEFSNHYIWRDPRVVDGVKGPPNNWAGFFGGSAWEYVAERDQYYLHLFLPSQPDLNWEDEKVRRAIYKTAIEFWLDRGVDGFRVDVCGCYSKDVAFPDAPVVDPGAEFQFPTAEMFANRPRMHEWLKEQRNEVLDKYGEDVVLVGELGQCPPDDLKKYLSPVDREMNIIFDFEIYEAGGVRFGRPFTEWDDHQSLKAWRKAIKKTQGWISELGLWATTFLENHDQPRSIVRYGSQNPALRQQSGKLLAMLTAVMSGTLFIYQGQEIGMTGIPAEWPRSELRDPFWIRFIEDAERRHPDKPELHKKAAHIVQRLGRDHARTPVQWSSEEPYAGFSTTEPWIRVNENFRDGINVKDQEDVPDSLLSFWKDLLKFRKSHLETMVYGHTKFVDNDNENVLSVIKLGAEQGPEAAGERSLCVLNYSDHAQPLPSLENLELEGGYGEVVFSTGPVSDSNELTPWEGRVYMLA